MEVGGKCESHHKEPRGEGSEEKESEQENHWRGS